MSVQLNDCERIWVKFNILYERCGIKVGRGAILHGPSGCGKSLLLRALASESGMNSIFVRVGWRETTRFYRLFTARFSTIFQGPELLSKYVGQSEENVR